MIHEYAMDPNKDMNQLIAPLNFYNGHLAPI